MQYQHEVGSPGLILRPLEPGDLGWVVQRHGLRYAAEYGWDVTFEGLVARIVAGFAERGDDKREAAWIAEMDGERVGCVFCAAAEAISTAQLRLLLVEPPARGAGVGTRLVNECLGFAARLGYTRIMLWTQDIQLEARRLYQRAGFKLDRKESHHSFGRDLVGEYWSRDLTLRDCPRGEMSLRLSVHAITRPIRVRPESLPKGGRGDY